MVHPWLSNSAQGHRYAEACLNESTAQGPTRLTTCSEHLGCLSRKSEMLSPTESCFQNNQPRKPCLNSMSPSH